MDDLHVWHNGYDWVVATTAEDARAVEHEVSLGGVCSHDDACDCEGDGWEQWPDDKTVTIHDLDGDEGPTQTKTCAEWVAQQGRGFLCSTEY